MISDPVHAFIDIPEVAVPNAAGGPLSGLSFGVKDIYDVAGIVTGCGSPEKRADGPPASRNAPVVDALLAAGAAFAGKTHTAELAFSLDGRNEHYGTPVNPAAPDRVPGGSSSGSAAAVAAGLVDFALGSDTGGSVRGPASFCGIIGLRTTFGRIDIGGTMPLAPSFDTVGWFARDIDVYDRVGAVLLGEDVEGPPLSRMLVAGDAFLRADIDARAALVPEADRVAQVLGSAGDIIVAPEGGLDGWLGLFRTIQGYEAWQSHGAWIERRRPDLNPAVRERFEVARKVTSDAYAEARDERLGVMRRVHDLLGKDTVLVLPTMPGAAPYLASTEAEFEAFRSRALPILCISGLSGCPQISLPLARVEGAPLGLSLLGPPGRDRALIAVARRFIAA